MVRETIEQLIKLQAMDTRLYAVDCRLARIPEELKSAKDEFERLNREKESVMKRYTLLKNEHTNAKLSLDEKKDMATAAQKKLLSVQNNKEYEAALKETDNLKRDIANLEKQTADTASEIKELDNVITETFAASEEKESAYNALKAQNEFENKVLYDEIAVLRKERDEFANTIRKNIIARYDRVRKARNNIAITPIHSETCSGCNMKVPPQFAVDVKRERDLLQCPYCQRFLYSPEKEISKDSA
ncbi:MAG: C4-type zinc ribbon domain-containing protein [Deferribacteraceae bacterium]|jgi:predicted  nucleic acid-binding Zn-ribbon protein|nr:C4-type zinc ribbon domain-containing protein [Deferribacteraceae bacterium]